MKKTSQNGHFQPCVVILFDFLLLFLILLEKGHLETPTLVYNINARVSKPQILETYLDTPLRHHLQNLLGIYRQSELVDCNTLRFLHIWRPGRGWHIHRYQYMYVHPRSILLDMYKSNFREYWYNTQKRHMVDICTHCHRAYRNLCLHNRRYNGTDYSNKRRFYIHGLSYNDNRLKKF